MAHYTFLYFCKEEISGWVFVPTIEEWGGTLYSGVLVFLFVFRAKSGTTNNPRTRLTDISY